MHHLLRKGLNKISYQGSSYSYFRRIRANTPVSSKSRKTGAQQALAEVQGSPPGSVQDLDLASYSLMHDS